MHDKRYWLVSRLHRCRFFIFQKISEIFVPIIETAVTLTTPCHSPNYNYLNSSYPVLILSSKRTIIQELFNIQLNDHCASLICTIQPRKRFVSFDRNKWTSVRISWFPAPLPIHWSLTNSSSFLSSHLVPTVSFSQFSCILWIRQRWFGFFAFSSRTYRFPGLYVCFLRLFNAFNELRKRGVRVVAALFRP